MTKYYAFGLIFNSPSLTIPEFIPITTDDFDVMIEFGSVKPLLSSSDLIRIKAFEKNKNSFLFRAEGVANYLIQDGNKILVDITNPNVTLDEVRLFLLGTCIGVLLQQRKVICLHASAIVYSDKVLLFTGDSGVGKSTTLSYFYKKGYNVMGDDVLPIKWKENKPYVVPSVPNIKLWDNSIVAMGFDEKHEFKQLRPSENKYRMTLKDGLSKKVLPVEKCIILDWTDKKEMSFSQIPTNDAIFAFKKNTYRKAIFRLHQDKINLFEHSINLANSVPLFIAKRNKKHHNIFEFIDYLSSKLGLA